MKAFHKVKQDATESSLYLVDLAGSECIGMSGVVGSAQRETKEINKSLCALGDVLVAQREQRTHIPYRNATLTHFLQPSLGMNKQYLRSDADFAFRGGS